MNRAARVFSSSASVDSKRRKIAGSTDSNARQIWISPLCSTGLFAADDHSMMEFIAAIARTSFSKDLYFCSSYFALLILAFGTSYCDEGTNARFKFVCIIL